MPKLKEGKAEMSLLPSISYAKGKGNWRILGDLCIASEGRAGSIALFFNQEMNRIDTVGVDRHTVTARALLQIIFLEKYQLELEFNEINDTSLETALEKHDAVLLTGDRVLQSHNKHTSSIDLGEEWFDLTGLPLVHAFWVGHELAVDETDVKYLINAHQMAKAHREEWVEEYCNENNLNAEEALNHIEQKMHFNLDQPKKESLHEFFKYAFYFGMIDHIPDLHFA